MYWDRAGEGGKAPNPLWGGKTLYVQRNHGIMGTTKFQSHHE